MLNSFNALKDLHLASAQIAAESWWCSVDSGSFAFGAATDETEYAETAGRAVAG